MNWIKRRWPLVTVIVLVILSLCGYLFRTQIGAFVGGYTKSPRGYYYRFIKGQPLEKVKGEGYHIIYQAMLLGPNGDTIFSGINSDVQQERTYPVKALNEMDDLMQIASPGSEVELLQPTDTLKTRYTSDIKILAMENGKMAKLYLKIIDILDGAGFAGYQNQRIAARLEKEFNMVDEYIKKAGGEWQLDSNDNTIKFRIENRSTKPRLKLADRVEFHIEIYSIHGDLITNSSMEGKKHVALMGAGDILPTGIETGLFFLAEGETGTFVMTSDHGFKEKGYQGVVKEYEPIVIKLKDIKIIK